MSARTPSNPMPPFIGSFITVGGKPLNQHYNEVSEITAKLDQIPSTAGPQLLDQAKAFARLIVPVRTGYLRSTIDWEQLSRYVFRFFASAAYARAVEEGTFRMPARPYMSPAMDRLKQQAPQVIINQVSQIFTG